MEIIFRRVDNYIDLLLNNIQEFKNQMIFLNECEENFQKIKLKNQFKLREKTNDKILKDKETEFDLINELYLRNKQIVENETLFNDLMNQFQRIFSTNC